jgi:hypothetical protein
MSAPSPAAANAPTLALPAEPWPVVRYAMTVVVPSTTGKPGRVTVQERSTGGRLIIQEDGSGIERSVDLTVQELRRVADHLQRIARRVARRPSYRP